MTNTGIITKSADQALPLHYNALEPLSSTKHSEYHFRVSESYPFAANTHATPITISEFHLVQRHMPIVFSIGDAPVPLALSGLYQGTNVFLGTNGEVLNRESYVPAYQRRYPFMLARLTKDTDTLSLCFDPTTDMVGPFSDGERLFDGDKPSCITDGILAFAEEFEIDARRTNLFIDELLRLKLLIPGEVSIRLSEEAEDFTYRGFMMVDEDKLGRLRGDQVRKLARNGILPLIYAHLLSLSLIKELFGRHLRNGTMPGRVPPEALAE